jgi:hypothetical protein
MFFRLYSLGVVAVSVGLLLGLGPMAAYDYQSLGFMHLLVIVAFYASFSFFKKDVKLMSTHYDLRTTMERTVKKAGSRLTQSLTVLFVAAMWLSPLLLSTLWWAAGQLHIDVKSTGVPFLWSVLSLSACIYLCVLNPVLRKKYK